MYKKIIACAAAFALIFGSAAAPAQTSLLDRASVTACADTFGDYEYEVLDDGTVKLTAYNGNDAEVVIPSEIDGKPVTGIGEDTFFDCRQLTNVILPDSLTHMDISAFCYCLGLTEITIPASVTEIDPQAIMDCIYMTQINVDPENSVYSSEDGILYNKDKTTLIRCPEGKTSAAVPEGVTYIGDYAFSGVVFLTDVTLPNSLVRIGDRAFEYCDHLTSIVLPEGLTSIGFSVFDCPELADITIPESLVDIGATAFVGSAWLDNKISEDPLVIVNNIVIEGQQCEGEVNIPEGVVKITDSAFTYSSITDVVFPESLVTIGEYAFFRNEGLTSVTIPGNVKNINSCAFNDCTNLTGLTIQDGVEYIGDGTFAACTALPSVTIPESVTKIDELAFVNCTDMTSVTILADDAEICNYAFGYYTEDDIYPLEDFTVYGHSGSTAERYAEQNGFAFVDLDEMSSTPDSSSEITPDTSSESTADTSSESTADSSGSTPDSSSSSVNSTASNASTGSTVTGGAVANTGVAAGTGATATLLALGALIVVKKKNK